MIQKRLEERSYDSIERTSAELAKIDRHTGEAARHDRRVRARKKRLKRDEEIARRA